MTKRTQTTPPSNSQILKSSNPQILLTPADREKILFRNVERLLSQAGK